MKSILTAICFGAALSAAALTTPALAQDAQQTQDAAGLEVSLTNLTSKALIVFQVSPSGEDEWQDVLPTDGYLPSGNQMPLAIGEGRDVCVHDLRFVMEDETVLEDFEVDLCASGAYTLEDD